MGRIKKLDARTVVVRSQELLERLDLQPGPDVPLASLSKGNCQKLVIAQAFLGPTDLLALDEPFSGLDPVAHAVLGELTTDAQAGGTIVLISSHFALPDQAAQLQLAIRNAGLVEIDSGEVPRGPTVDVMEVELLPTETASGRGEVASIPGVSQARLVPPQGLLVLLTDRHHIDIVLTAAIVRAGRYDRCVHYPLWVPSMIALIRYVARDTFRSQRWVAPLLCFAAIDAIVGAQTGSVLPSMRSSRLRYSSS